MKDIGTDFIDIDLIPQEEVESEEPEAKESRIILLDDTQRLKRIIMDVSKDINLMYKIHHRDFEEIVAELLRKQNFEVSLTPRTRDGGYDIIAVQSLSGMRNKYLVECKRYGPDRPVGVEIVRGLMFVVQNAKANKGIICTTSYFSPDVKREFNQYIPYQLELKDNNNMLDWISKYK
ncbi:MAG TPA: restriction endonuclease [Bacteroidia bacterium]|nr:restriction endonuclease [Bacteroidia bacterium]